MREEINLTHEQIEKIFKDLGVCLCADEDLTFTRKRAERGTSPAELKRTRL